MKNSLLSLLIVPLLGLLMLFQNCANKSFTESTAQPPSSVEAGTDIKDVDDDVIQEVKINCDNARAAGALVQSKQMIEFSDTREETGRAQICEFSKNDNLGILDTFMQARYEQQRRLQLPENAVICDLEMKTALQRFQYDDVFVFNYNNFILATNNKTALYSTTRPETTLNLDSGLNVPIYRYDWLKLRGASFNNVADDFCLGSDQNLASCSWPISERTGNIVFSFDQRLLIALGLTHKSNYQTFSFVITGDNDLNQDCFHEELSFEMNISYYLKK